MTISKSIDDRMMVMKAPTKLPFMTRVPEGEWISMEVDWTTCDDTENDKGWSAYTAMLADINFEKTKDGKHEVPFWARDSFWELYEQRAIEGEQTLDDIEFCRIVDGQTPKGKPNNIGKFRLGK